MWAQGDHFLQALASWRDPKWGLLTDKQGAAVQSGNALLYEGHAAIIYRDLEDFTGAPMVFFYSKSLLEIQPGLFNRKPDSNEPQAHDDYTGLAAASVLTAQQIRLRGKATGWFYDNNAPEMTLCGALKAIAKRVQPISYLKFWHGRMPGQVTHYRIGANRTEEVSVLAWVVWALSIMWTVRKAGNESGWLLDYLKLRAALKVCPTHPAVRLTAWWYKRQLRKHYGSKISNVYAVYFSPGHPFARYAQWP